MKQVVAIVALGLLAGCSKKPVDVAKAAHKKACACTDHACAQAATRGLYEWQQDNIFSGKIKMSDEEQKEFDDYERRADACRTELKHKEGL